MSDHTEFPTAWQAIHDI